MSGEVILMEDFQPAIETPIRAHIRASEEAHEDWDWAVDKSFECINEAQNPQKIEMLISNLADDLMRIAKELSGKKYPVTQLYDAVSRGIELNSGLCEHCSGE